MKTYLMTIIAATFLSGTALAYHCDGKDHAKAVDVKTAADAKTIKDDKVSGGMDGDTKTKDLGAVTDPVADKDSKIISSSSDEDGVSADTKDKDSATGDLLSSTDTK